MLTVYEKLKAEKRPILIYGTGNGADKLIDCLNEKSIKISGVFVSDGFVRERSFRGFKVLSFETAKMLFNNFVGLISFGTSRADTLNYVKDLATKTTLYMPEMPVIGTEVFDLEFAQKHKTELEDVYNILSDEKSKNTFKGLINFKLSGELEYLFNIEENEEKEFFKILNLAENSSFLDLGAYNGDTALQYATRMGKNCKITAVEPDKKSFKKLIKNTEGLNINCINAAVCDRVGTVQFSAQGDRGSTIGVGESVDALTIDYLFEKQDFDYIKFDLEGAELSAIIGAKNTIANKKPKMLISCYHKSDDYFTIPKKVLEFNPSYKVYMRHFPSIPAWDTVFYFV